MSPKKEVPSILHENRKRLEWKKSYFTAVVSAYMLNVKSEVLDAAWIDKAEKGIQVTLEICYNNAKIELRVGMVRIRSEQRNDHWVWWKAFRLHHADNEETLYGFKKSNTKDFHLKLQHKKQKCGKIWVRETVQARGKQGVN